MAQEADVKMVRISVASMFQIFHPCEADFIKNVCHAQCGCAPKARPVFVQTDREDRPILERHGIRVDSSGRIIPLEDGRCPACDPESFLCGLHLKGPKPLGCRTSPFVLSKHDILMVQNRYRRLKCFKPESGGIPVYKAHRWSLEQIFGPKEAAWIVDKLEYGEPCDYYDGRWLIAGMPAANYRRIKSIQSLKKG